MACTGRHMLTLIEDSRSSYRDLLSTAERITRLDGFMQEAEASMADLSRKCNSDAVEREARTVAQRAEEKSSKSIVGQRILHDQRLTRHLRLWESRCSGADIPPAEVQAMHITTIEAARLYAACSKGLVVVPPSSEDTQPGRPATPCT